MDRMDPATLLDLSIQSLLSNEPAAIRALKEIPRELFPLLFNAAFKNGHKNTLKAMVEIWPFICLHIGALTVQEPQCELLKAMVESLPFLPTSKSASWSSKLRVLDLRQDASCKTICPKIFCKSPICFHSCAYSEHAILKLDGQCRISDSKSEGQSSRQRMELLVDLSLDGTLREWDFLSLLMSKVDQSLGSLHLCCRDLQIDKLSNWRCTLQLLNLKCVDNLVIGQASLSEVTNILSQMAHLSRLSLSKITYRSLNGKAFKNFTTHLRRMVNLQELSLSYFCLTNHLGNLLRVLPPRLNFLYLTFSELSYNDFRFLSLCPQVSHLKILNLSNNPMYWEDCEPIHNLLAKISGTLEHLTINHCLLTDFTISALLPALSHCSKLCVLSFAFNPITMPMLSRILQHLTPLTELKYVIYPIPTHCYGRWHFQSTLDRDKLADVESKLKVMLEVAQRDDMNWVTFSDQIS